MWNWQVWGFSKVIPRCPRAVEWDDPFLGKSFWMNAEGKTGRQDNEDLSRHLAPIWKQRWESQVRRDVPECPCIHLFSHGRECWKPPTPEGRKSRLRFSLKFSPVQILHKGPAHSLDLWPPGKRWVIKAWPPTRSKQ